MLMIIMSTAMAATISIMLMMMCTTISKKTKTDREKMTPFECGFDPKSTARLPFSIQFFLIAILFLIFDIEIAIILPMTVTMKTSNIMNWTMTMTMFITTLTLGLYYEWKNNMLEWT
uniref:NADH-ubiquinone oxidoreductase chain 3 n=1 Tax=Appolonius crassus TaxID=2813428 RepID=A0A8T9ZWB3_9HEMI|nr:NADH dehydrogenase subunit 3 [Appolonius crassus]